MRMGGDGCLLSLLPELLFHVGPEDCLMVGEWYIKKPLNERITFFASHCILHKTSRSPG
jgi:hypothetical protein